MDVYFFNFYVYALALVPSNDNEAFLSFGVGTTPRSRARRHHYSNECITIQKMTMVQMM